jgi:hypothetical protein
MTTTTESKIPTTYLPDDWREMGVKEFKCSASTIEKIVYGTRPVTPKNKKIFLYMLALAEAGKKAHDEINERLNALAQ